MGKAAAITAVLFILACLVVSAVVVSARAAKTLGRQLMKHSARWESHTETVEVAGSDDSAIAVVSIRQVYRLGQFHRVIQSRVVARVAVEFPGDPVLLSAQAEAVRLADVRNTLPK